MRRRSRQSALCVSLASLAWLGCSGCTLERLRSHTYPPSFNYIPAEELRSTMWTLADHMARLDSLMRASGAAGEALQEKVILELVGMDRAAAALGPAGWPSNHPRVSRNLERFRQELEAARRAAEADPPNYYLAGSVSGACMHCHAND